jgi:hypothetical protein
MIDSTTSIIHRNRYFWIYYKIKQIDQVVTQLMVIHLK